MIVRDTDVRFSIDPVSGEITNNSEKDTITQGSHNSEVFTFEMPRNIGHDMLECNLVEVHYLNIKAKDKTQRSEGIYKVNDLQVCPEDDTKVILSWLIDGSSTVHHGTLSFSIHFKCISKDGKCLYRWPTKTFSKIAVTSCVDTTDAVMEDNQDIIAEWEARITALEQNGCGSGGVPAMIVVAHDEGTANYTATEIYEHVLSGGNVYIRSLDLLIPLYTCTESISVFRIERDDEVVGASVDENGAVTNAAKKIITESDLADFRSDVGNISTALDHIIALQEELISL